MEIPESCRDWSEQMKADDRTRAVLENIQNDECIPSSIEQEFFKQLESTAPWNSPEDAWEKAKSVVWGAITSSSTEFTGDFFCHGATVPEDQMATLIRFAPYAEWERRLEDWESERLVALAETYGKASGLDNTLSDNGVRARFCADLAEEYPTGHRNGITWVSDAEEINADSAGVHNILRRLGLPYFEEGGWVLVLQYKRIDVDDPLHVPRALDGVAHWPFEVQDCNALVGMTKPTEKAPEGANGFPESIHRSVMIKMHQVQLREIDGH